MNRKKAVIYIVLGIAGLFATWMGCYWWKRLRRPDLSFLDTSLDLIAEIAETIIPRTDTPGAKDAKVELFIIAMVKSCLPLKEQHTYKEGLELVDSKCLWKYGAPFAACEMQQRIALLQEFEAQDSWMPLLLLKVKHKLLGRSFMAIFKDLTITGYCTSKEGAQLGLAYDYIPMTYQGCLHMPGPQRAWATS